MNEPKLADVLMVDDENTIKPRRDWREAFEFAHATNWVRYMQYAEDCQKHEQRPLNFDDWRAIEQSVE